MTLLHHVTTHKYRYHALTILIAIIMSIIFIKIYAFSPTLTAVTKTDTTVTTPTSVTETTPETVSAESVPPTIPPESAVTHMTTPTNVRALYMSSWIASGKNDRKKIIDLIEQSKSLNAVIIDIKDDTGRISFLTPDAPSVTESGSPSNRIRDIRELIQQLHEKDIYVIGRIAVFQDPYLTHKYPDWAIRRKSDGAIWKDRKGLSFLDPTNKHVWEYMRDLAIASHNVGFDEINFDYIRFPSDGNISDIAYPASDVNLSRADHIENFFAYINKHVRETGIPTSADLFGMTTTNTDDLGIGQVLERAIPYFDYIAPMIYPSHYPPNFHGYKNPAANPGDIVRIAMTTGVARAEALGKTPAVFRPWIQDFNMGATYGAAEVRAQIQSLEKLGIDSYMVWDPGNSYTTSAYIN
jgi:hypothetical protein